MVVKQKITLELSRETLPVTVHVKQYDVDTREIEVTLLDKGQMYEIESGIKARLHMTKSDGYIVLTDGEITDGKVKVTLPGQALTAYGMARAEIGLYKGETLLSSPVFYISVDKAAYDQEGVESSDDFGALVDALGKVDGATETASEATDAARTAAKSASEAATAANKSKSDADAATSKANKAATDANTAANTATTAAGNATTAASTANTAAGKATTAAEAAEKAASDATAALEELDNHIIKKYSVHFSGSAAAGTRADNAVGMRAGVQIGADGSGVVNDFDAVPFFNRPICCCSWDSTAREWRVNAYKGEPGFAADGSNGEVMYECTPFYLKATFDGTGAPTYASVTATPCEGYILAPGFRDASKKEYRPSYWTGMVGDKPTSRSGVFPAGNSLDGHMTNARKFDEKAHLETIEVVFSDYILMLVEFATKDVQTVMMGACSMRYNAEDKISSVLSDTQFTTTAAIGGNYVDGQTICIGTAKNGTQRHANVVVTSIVTEGGVSTFTLAEAVSSMAAGDYISSRCWTNGATDFVTASSGTAANDGKHPCIWRGKVDPWADAYSTLCNLLYKRYGAGTAEDPYTVKPQYLPEPWKYSSGNITEDYIEADFNTPYADGYVKTLGQDSRYPFLINPTELGASSTTFAAAYYWYPRAAVTAARVGGNLHDGRICSPVSFGARNAPGSSYFNYRARLFCSP